MTIWIRNDCPNCMTNEFVRRRKTIGNGLSSALNVVLFPLWLLLCLFTSMPIYWRAPMSFICKRCGTRFRGEKRHRTPIDECARCEYSLLGNKTGRCPECGWRIPHAFRRKLVEHPKPDE